MTVTLLSCPVCHFELEEGATICGRCGVNLEMAAALVENAALSVIEDLPEDQISPEILVPRLGDYLVERGILTQEELNQALIYQKKKQREGEPKLIGQALIELDLITREELDKAVTEQIYILQSALKQANEELEARVRQRTVELEKALGRLAELEQLKSNFVANVSHELRTPLTHLRGYLELLLDEALGPLTPEQANALQVMSKAEARLGNLIEDLIQFSAFSRGVMDVQLAVVDVRPVLDEVKEKARYRCEEKGLTFQAKIPEKLPPVCADRDKLSWVLSHFIDNAVKFTSPGGRVQLGAYVQDGRVHFYVYDTGIGIPPERVDEIFEPFHQLDGSATRRFGGTGIGLTIAKRIVEGHGAEITVRSKVGEGSYFEFALVAESESTT